jgi:hypothetical protein
VAYDTEIAALSKISKDASAEIQAFADSVAGLTCLQREALVQIIEQILSLEAQGDEAAVAQLLKDTPALLRLTSASS